MQHIIINVIKGIVIVAIVAFVLLLFSIQYSSIGTGSHTGYVTAVDQRGYIFKNYDVYFKTDNSSSQEDTYCAFRNDKELIAQLQQAGRDGTRVTIDYRGVRGIGFGLCHYTRIESISQQHE